MSYQNINPQTSKLITYYSKILSKTDLDNYAKYFSMDLPTAFRVNKQNKSIEFQKSLENLIYFYMQQRIQSYIEKQKENNQNKDNQNNLNKDQNNQNNQSILNENIQLDLSQIFYKLPIPSAFYFTPGRSQLRSDESLNQIHKFLVVMNESGLVTRQEYVSMLPPAFLDCQPGDKVLDMCAAPGSKTSQLLEQVGVNGLVVANDVDLPRCHTLMHGLISQPTPQLIITNLDASKMPRFTTFDRVLADVPCSGDGTLRKSKELWAKWNPAFALALHELQLKILIRGLQLLKIGGTICYSTCSLNPMEDESVVSTILQKFGDSIEIQDCNEKLVGLKREHGLQSWEVATSDMQFYSEWKVELKGRRIQQTMFPPKDAHIKSELTKAMRVYPWLNDSGGFFVCVIKKVKDLPKEELSDIIEVQAESYKNRNQNTEYSCNYSKKLPLYPQRKIENEAILKQIQNIYDFKSIFEEGDAAVVLQNSSQREQHETVASRVYILNKYCQEILYSSVNAFFTYHIVQAGCGCFEKKSGQHNKDGIYRVEGIMSYILQNTKFAIKLSYEMFLKALSYGLAADENHEQNVNSVIFADLSDTSIDEINYLKSNEVQKNQTYLIQMKESDNNQLQKTLIDGLFLTCFIGFDSICINVKRKFRNALHCLLNNLNIEQLIQSGESIRKAAYKQRREEKRQNKGKQESKEGNDENM